MKKVLLFFTCIGIFIATNSYACMGSNCKECPDGFSLISGCCKGRDMKDCIPANDDDHFCKKAALAGYSEYILQCYNFDSKKWTDRSYCPKCADIIFEEISDNK